jgi:hypothetical protein
MANIINKVTSNVPHSIERRGFSGYAVDKAERYAAAAGFGFVKGYYRERAAVRGVPADLLAGAGLIGAAMVLEVFSKGRSALAPHLNAVGDAGMMSYLGSMGAAMGAKKSGRQVYVLNAGAAKPAALPAGLTAVGALPQAVGGAFLSADQIARFSAAR